MGGLPLGARRDPVSVGLGKLVERGVARHRRRAAVDAVGVQDAVEDARAVALELAALISRLEPVTEPTSEREIRASRGDTLFEKRPSAVRSVFLLAERLESRAGGWSRLAVEYLSYMVQRGAYPADRAAALSGVPVSTVHWWARHDVLVPSISAQRVKLWSYPDLMGLRIIYWLRQVKEAPDGVSVPRTTMPSVRCALAQLAELDLRLWSEDTGPTVRVDRGGNVHVLSKPDPEASNRQRALDLGGEDLLDVIEPFLSVEGSRGPDLVRPRPLLRIVPGKLGGSPHVIHTRLESQAIGALAASGLPEAKIYRLYPDVEPKAIEDALDLERQLERNLRPAVAA